MTTDEDKTKITKLLDDLEVPDIKLSERCSDLVKDFRQRFGKDVEEEEEENKEFFDQTYENPFKVDESLLAETNKKLQMLLNENKRARRNVSRNVLQTEKDPKRPWRTHSNKEKLLRINGELREHYEKGSQAISPLQEDHMKDLIKECQDEGLTAPPVDPCKLKSTVDDAKRDLPNFQYTKLRNSTAVAILPEAHEISTDNELNTLSDPNETQLGQDVEDPQN